MHFLVENCNQVGTEIFEAVGNIENSDTLSIKERIKFMKILEVLFFHHKNMFSPVEVFFADYRTAAFLANVLVRAGRFKTMFPVAGSENSFGRPGAVDIGGANKENIHGRIN